ncbi:hypothetical protein Bpfe_024937 [Biomphalaria pfeifferi]|uniref:Uncharacterized protein n=1 Tax=Biomphalaria pfeifferi TaxID=112525 RepID=A0AAD8B096_BIOPF|nr:hypothetical protein Bpfe_024937 [Biomphalaria pfeifferi]
MVHLWDMVSCSIALVVFLSLAHRVELKVSVPALADDKTKATYVERVKNFTLLYAKNCSGCENYADIQSLQSLDEVCRKYDAFFVCSQHSNNCSRSFTGQNDFQNICVPRKRQIVQILEPLANSCYGRCDSYYEAVKTPDLLDLTCGKLDDLDNCMSARCENYDVYKTVLDDANKLCDGCGCLHVSLLLLLVALVFSKWTA